MTTRELTADTITDEQIDALWREATGPGSHQLADTDTMYLCNVARNARGYYPAHEQDAARARCAAILNARAAAGKAVTTFPWFPGCGSPAPRHKPAPGGGGR